MEGGRRGERKRNRSKGTLSACVGEWGVGEGGYYKLTSRDTTR